MVKGVDPEVLCNKIKEIFPDIGECAIDVKVYFDEEVNRYAVLLEKGGKTAKVYLEDDEITDCLEGRKCVSLALQIGQFK
ncbi:hypothetical protein THC_1436 [Caldimicrobium thiodismutans]|jgi:hypothetical protein|uniref:Uncharacterized protein n=1 Tax=Caldimicrobium thiodismutans TaxID=1653476 RepID=A0A0U5B164_9BACT|nr:hypothetical protein [Caldimicrobium thiodismutans]BAU23801.1 hypothetical protein THC_1436 [Caldimicrobium thiodismutans]